MKPRHILTALTLCVLSSSALADSVWVKADSADIRSGKAAVYPVVGTAKKGQELSVITHDGKWYQIQIPNGPAGWLADASVSTTKVNGDLKLFSSDTASMGTGAAARGLQPGAESYVATRHLDKRNLDSLIALRKTIAPAEYERFTTSANVGAR